MCSSTEGLRLSVNINLALEALDLCGLSLLLKDRGDSPLDILRFMMRGCT